MRTQGGASSLPRDDTSETRRSFSNKSFLLYSSIKSKGVFSIVIFAEKILRSIRSRLYKLYIVSKSSRLRFVRRVLNVPLVKEKEKKKKTNVATWYHPFFDSIVFFLSFFFFVQFEKQCRSYPFRLAEAFLLVICKYVIALIPCTYINIIRKIAHESNH